MSTGKRHVNRRELLHKGALGGLGLASFGPPSSLLDVSRALANGGSLDNIEPGINFFARLKKLGNWNPTDAYTANIAKGTTPIAIKWDYLNLATRDEMKGNPAATVTIPRHGVYGGYYGQAISKYAPHPNAAKLWLEYLYSDAGQLM